MLASAGGLTVNASSREARGGATGWPGDYRCAVSLSFDDAKRSQLRFAVPALDEREIVGTFYLSTLALEQARDRGRSDLLNQWATSHARGHELGNHTRTHPCSANFSWVRAPHRALEDLSVADITDEIEHAQRFLEIELGAKATTFAYPCGMSYVGRGRERQSYVPVVAKTFQVGRAFNSECAASPARCDLACVPAISMDNKDATELLRLVRDAEQNGHWLILVGHDVADREAPYSTRMRAFMELLDGLRAMSSTIWVDTVARIGSYLAASRI
jgi:peptidoglycan/xylan/chitin deacetylase (PgdA/CDA1 family)